MLYKTKTLLPRKEDSTHYVLVYALITQCQPLIPQEKKIPRHSTVGNSFGDIKAHVAVPNASTAIQKIKFRRRRVLPIERITFSINKNEW